ncbi:hypothetical protein Trydic_g20766 [Trypoxylus dichotomus]
MKTPLLIFLVVNTCGCDFFDKNDQCALIISPSFFCAEKARMEGRSVKNAGLNLGENETHLVPSCSLTLWVNIGDIGDDEDPWRRSKIEIITFEFNKKVAKFVKPWNNVNISISKWLINHIEERPHNLTRSQVLTIYISNTTVNSRSFNVTANNLMWLEVVVTNINVTFWNKSLTSVNALQCLNQDIVIVNCLNIIYEYLITKFDLDPNKPPTED